MVHLHCPTPIPLPMKFVQNQWKFASVSVKVHSTSEHHLSLGLSLGQCKHHYSVELWIQYYTPSTYEHNTCIKISDIFLTVQLKWAYSILQLVTGESFSSYLGRTPPWREQRTTRAWYQTTPNLPVNLNILSLVSHLRLKFIVNPKCDSMPSRHSSVGRASAWSHTVSSGTIGPSFEPHQCLLTGMWIRMAQLPCWPPRGQQVSHQRWILGMCNMNASAKCK